MIYSIRQEKFGPVAQYDPGSNGFKWSNPKHIMIKDGMAKVGGKCLYD